MAYPCLRACERSDWRDYALRTESEPLTVPVNPEGWYDTTGDYHKGWDYETWYEGLTEGAPEYVDLERVVFDFGEGDNHDYKTIFLEDWAEYWDDEDVLFENIEEWYDSEYGEAH